MREENLIKITTIQYDKLPINKEVLDLVFFILSGGMIPPIKIRKAVNGWELTDGRHRLAACKLLGETEILARYYEPKPSKKWMTIQ